MEQLLERAYETFTDEARRRSIDYRVEVERAAGDRLGRRPGAPDRRQPALERVPGDARRRADPARARPGERHDQRLRRGHGPGDPAREARAALPAVRLRGAPAAPGSGSRSRRSSPARSAAGSTSSRSSAAARASSCCLPRARGGRRSCRSFASASPRRPGAASTTSPRGSSACSIRSSRSLSPRHWPVIRSTRSARSSMRACRSASRSVSSRSRRRIVWFASPFTSASRREIGAASSRSPSRSALADRIRQDDLELVGRQRERLDLEPRAIERRGDLGRERVAIVHRLRR